VESTVRLLEEKEFKQIQAQKPTSKESAPNCGAQTPRRNEEVDTSGVYPGSLHVWPPSKKGRNLTETPMKKKRYRLSPLGVRALEGASLGGRREKRREKEVLGALEGKLSRSVKSPATSHLEPTLKAG